MYLFKYTLLLNGFHIWITLNTVYVNPDGLSGFGTPWEIAFVGNYTVRTKGGNVDGYSALFSFIPELKLSRSLEYID